MQANLKTRIKARGAVVTDPHEGAPWEDALNQAGAGWLGGPFPFDGNGKLVMGFGAQLPNPAFRFGVQRGGKLRAVDDLKWRRWNRAAAAQTPVNPPTWGDLPAIFRMFQGERNPECLATAKKVHKEPHKELPVRDEHKVLKVAT